MTPYALPELLIKQQSRLRAFAVRSFCRQILEALAKRYPERAHVRYSDEHVTCVYWPAAYKGFTDVKWMPGMLMETHGIRFFNELEGRVLLVRDDVAASLGPHLPSLRRALMNLTGMSLL